VERLPQPLELREQRLRLDDRDRRETGRRVRGRDARRGGDDGEDGQDGEEAERSHGGESFRSRAGVRGTRPCYPIGAAMATIRRRDWGPFARSKWAAGAESPARSPRPGAS